MRLFSIEFKKGEALYLQLYSYIKESIINGSLKPNEMLPSKRKLSTYLNISLNTVIEAYDLLLDEELITSIPRRGYYVLSYNIKKNNKEYNDAESIIKKYKYDFSTKNIDSQAFPYYTWNKISKNVIYNDDILIKSSNLGYYKLRNTIKGYLYESKGVNVNPNNIIIGSGIEYLLTILIQLIDSNRFILENPGYDKVYKILKNNNKDVILSDVDNEGIVIDNVVGDIVYVTPQNQFPTGIKMSMKRKVMLAEWAVGDKYIIEDDFDSEFKYLSNQSISLLGLNPTNTILLSTYSRSISPALRIAYMVLPDKIIENFNKRFSFYSNTVSTMDQMILNEFISSGAYSRHLNKTKLLFKEKRELIIKALEKYDYIKIDRLNSYLSLIVEVKLDKDKFKELAAAESIDISLMDNYYLDNKKSDKLIIGYSGISIDEIENGINKLIEIIEASHL